jgi:hypothetical protein
MSSALRFRPWRSASASSATWSLTPSTSTTAREAAPVASACAAAATSGVPPPPSGGATAGGWNRRLSFTCLAQKVYVARVHSLVLFARHPQLLRFRYNGHRRVHFPRCRLSRRLAGEVGFGAPRDSRSALGDKGQMLCRILHPNFGEYPFRNCLENSRRLLYRALVATKGGQPGPLDRFRPHQEALFQAHSDFPNSFSPKVGE